MNGLNREKFYKPGEIAKIWRVSTAAVLAEFRTRPGVFRIGKGRLRIPENVLRQVMEERGYVAHENDDADG